MATIRTAIELQDNFSSVLYSVVNAVNLGLSAMEDLQHTMNAPIDTASLDGAREAANQAAMAVQQLNEAMQGMSSPVGDTPTAPVSTAPVNIPTPQPTQWQSYDGLEVFKNTGVERFEQEVASVNSMLQDLNATQSRITQAAAESEVLSPQARYDVEAVENRVQALQQSIEQVEQNPLNIGSDSANASLEQLRARLSQTLELQDNLNAAMQGADISQINAAYLQFSQNISETERMVRDSFENIPPVEIPVTWKTDSLEVFTSTGVDRFQQEVQSANNMLNTLNTTQERIASTAAQTNLFPASAVADMNNMQNRLQAIQQRIQQIESNPMNMGTDRTNAELERLRGQLDRAVQEQENLNRAVDNMDVDAANQAYLRLSQTVGNTERYIRDNVDEQGNFNQAITEGTHEANGLMNTIKGAVAAYVTIQSVTSALNLSDQLTSTTARLNLMNDGLQTTAELQDMIYLSAERARGSYQATADAVSKLGLMAGDAFGSSEEIVAFMEQINKQFTIAGTETAGIDAAMLQLTQAMGSGVLRGEEYNSILEQAPNIIQAIADYMEVPKGQLKDMAADGAITADIVKAAMFAAADETNEKFASMPKTFSQIWTSFQNTALMAFQPVLQRMNEIANSEAFQGFVNNAIEALSMVAGIALEIFDLLVGVAEIVGENWSWISPIIYGIAGALAVYYGALLITKGAELAVAAAHGAMTFTKLMMAAATTLLTGATWAESTAQWGLNAALYACPIVWIIVLIIALVALFYAAVAAVNKFAQTSVSATGIIIGALTTIGARILNVFILAWNVVASYIEFLVNVWKHPEYAIKAFVVNVITAFLQFCLACITGTQSAIGIVIGIWHAFAQAIENIVAIIWNTIAAGIEAVVNGWNSGIYQVKSFFVDLAVSVLGVAQSITQSMGNAASAIANTFIGAINTIIGALNSLIDAMNCIPGINIGKVGEFAKVNWDFGASAIADTASALQASLGGMPTEWNAPILELGDMGDAYRQGKEIGTDLVSGWENSLSSAVANLDASIIDKPEDYWEAPKFDYINLSDAAMAGYEFGEGLEDKVKNFTSASLFDTTHIPSPQDYANSLTSGTGGLSGIGDDVSDIAGNTGSIADAMDITEEDLKYLRDIAEQEVINRYTLAEVNIEQTNHNNVSSTMDLDGVVSGLTDAVNEAVDMITEGVHV